MFKNKFTFIIILLVVLAAGGFYFYSNNSTSNIAGNDKDVHGCIGSAGYTFSPLKNECIRIFESGVRMDPRDEKLDQTTSAFVVFKNQTEYQTAELFLPNQGEPLNLDFKSGTWSDKDGKYFLKKIGNNLILLDENRVLQYEYEDSAQKK